MDYLTCDKLKMPMPIYYISQALIVLGIAFYSLQLHSYDLRVPFHYDGDSVVILMYIKGLIQDGWPSTISQLSAPFTYSGAAFPMLTSFDWVIIKILSIFTDEPGYLLNVFWLLTLVLSSWTASFASYQLGLSRVFSVMTGILYAFLPFALLRNVGHMNLVYYLVPFLSLLAIVVAGRGAGIRNVKQAIIAGLVACVLQGFNYVYYSFFSVILFGVAILISYKRTGGLNQFKLPLIAIALITLSTAVNIIPTLQSWNHNGSPPEMGYKHTAESEIYGAKIRRMLTPHPDNFIYPLAKYAQKDLHANFPNENENTTARLGLYGSLGLLLMILLTVRRVEGNDSFHQPMAVISSLGLATILIITVGGFGAIINLLSVPDIRCYNRFSVFLSFFAMVATGLWLQAWVNNKRFHLKLAGYFIVAGFVALSLYDQLLDAKHLVSYQKNDIHRATEERMVVERMEKIFKNSTAVLELPFTGFPPLSIVNKMQSYDHARPFIWSQHLKWSWPSFSQRHRVWQTKMAAMMGQDLIKAAILSGFEVIWIDRFAYLDEGRELISSLTLGNVKQLDVESDRFVVLDLRDAVLELKTRTSTDEFAQQVADLIGNSVIVEWKRGFYGEEINQEGHQFRWAKNRAKIVLRNTGKETLRTCVSFDIASATEGTIQLESDDIQVGVKSSNIPTLIQFPLKLEAGEARVIRFLTNLPRYNVRGDGRKLYFYVMDFSVSKIASAVNCDVI